MPEALPYNTVSSADVYAYVDIYLPIAKAIWGVNKMWEVEFFMPEALPDNMVASAHANA